MSKKKNPPKVMVGMSLIIAPFGSELVRHEKWRTTIAATSDNIILDTLYLKLAMVLVMVNH